MGSSVGSREVELSDRILVPSRRVTRAEGITLCLATSSVSVPKRQKQPIVLAIIACLLTSTIAQHEGSSGDPYHTPQGARDVTSTSLVSRHSTEARRIVEQGLQNPSTEVQPDLLARGRNLYTGNLVADPVDPTVPVHIAGTSWDPSKASGSPVDKNSTEILDLSTSSLGGTLAEMDPSPNASSRGLRDSTGVLQKGIPRLFSTISPPSPLLPDVAGSSSRSERTPASQMAPTYPSTVSTPNTASSIARPIPANDLTSAKPPASNGSPANADDLPGTSRPLAEISHTAHLDQKPTSHSRDVLPSAETGFLTRQAVEGASVRPKMLRTSVSLPTLPTGMVPPGATRAATNVFHSSSRVTAQSFLESLPHVSTGMHSGSVPTQSLEASSRSMSWLQEAALNGQGPGGAEPATRDPLQSTATPTALLRFSTWPLSSYFQAHVTLLDLVTQVASSETEGLATHSLLVPASAGSPKLDGATALSMSTGGAPAIAEKGTEIPLSMTSRMETSEARVGVGEGTVPSVLDLAAVSALAGKGTLAHLATLQNIPGSETESGFPVSSASSPASHAPGTDSASSRGAVSQMEMGPTTRSPHSSPAVSPSVRFSPSTVPLELETVAAENSTGEVLSAHWSTTPGEGSTRLGPASWVNLPTSLGTREEQEGFPTTRVLSSPSPGEGTSHEWKEGRSPTVEPSTDVLGRTSVLGGWSEPTSFDVRSHFLPTDASSLPAFSAVYSRGVESGYTVPFLHSLAPSSTLEALPSAEVIDLGSYREKTQPELSDGTEPITAAAAGKVPDSSSEPPLAASSTDSSSSLTSTRLGVQPAGKHFALSTRSTPSQPPSSTFLTTSGVAVSKDSSEPETRTVSLAMGGASRASGPVSSTMSDATLPSQFLDAAGVAHPFQTTAGGTQHVGVVVGSPSTSYGRELFNRTQSEWRFPLPTLSQALANRTEVVDTSRATDTSTGFIAPSMSYRSSSQGSASLSHVESKHTMMPQPNTTQAVSLSSSATDLPATSIIFPTTQPVPASSFATDPPAGSRILPTTQGVSLSSSTTDMPASSRILPTIQAVSLSSSAKDMPASSRILPTTQTVSPSSFTTDIPASSRILPTIQAVSLSSSAKDMPASSRILPATQAVSPSSSATDLPSSSRIFPTTQTMSPSSSATRPRILPMASMLTTRGACSDVHCLNNTHPASFAPLPRTSAQLPMISQTLLPKVLDTTLGSSIGKKGTVTGSSTKMDTPKVTYTTALTGMKSGTITSNSPTSKHLVSAPRASTVGQTAERDNITLSRRTLAVSTLLLEFHLIRIDYTESLANKSSARYKKLEREVILTLNKMLSFYETFLRASVLRFLNGSVIAQTEAVFRGDDPVPTPSDMIRRIVTMVEQREMGTFFEWRVDLRSLRCNGFSLRNLDPEVLAISFTVLGQGSVATFGGLTDWGPLESLRNEVVWSLGIRYKVQNFSLVRVRNVQGDLDISGEIYVDTAAHVDISWALEALKGLANDSVDLGSVCINGSRMSLQIFPVSFLVTNRIFSEKLLDRSSVAHRSLSWDLSKALMHTLGQYKNLLQVTIREVRGGSLICYADVIFEPPAPTSKDLVHALALSVGPKNYLGASGIQVDPFSFTVAGATLEPPFANPRIPGYGIALIVLSGLALIVIPVLVLLYKHLGWKEKMIIQDPEMMVETFELDNPTFRSLTEDNSTQSCSPTEVFG